MRINRERQIVIERERIEKVSERKYIDRYIYKYRGMI